MTSHANRAGLHNSLINHPELRHQDEGRNHQAVMKEIVRT